MINKTGKMTQGLKNGKRVGHGNISDIGRNLSALTKVKKEKYHHQIKP